MIQLKDITALYLGVIFYIIFTIHFIITNILNRVHVSCLTSFIYVGQVAIVLIFIALIFNYETESIVIYTDKPKVITNWRKEFSK